ncbi:MAG: hypothetical protein MJ250_02075 [Alphaproteobacteria bacterium]|nr:hypothetical protein [Alphaproteobacteria bacterium]
MLRRIVEHNRRKGNYFFKGSLILSTFYPITIYGNGEKNQVDVSIECSEIFSKADNLQGLLCNAKNIIEQFDVKEKEFVDVLEIAKSNLENLENRISCADEDIKIILDNRKQSDQELNNVLGIKQSFENNCDKVKELLDENEQLKIDLKNQIQRTKELNQKIEDLIPGATSVGLASSFNKKVSDLTPSKYIWLSIFIGCLIWLFIVILNINKEELSGANDIQYLFKNIPFVIAPIWGGWFSARSYGHIVRLQEKYNYKSAMSIAFEGYKKQFADIKTSESVEGMLSILSMKVLSDNPSDVFERGCNDETPFHSIISKFIKTFSKNKEENKI